MNIDDTSKRMELVAGKSSKMDHLTNHGFKQLLMFWLRSRDDETDFVSFCFNINVELKQNILIFHVIMSKFTRINVSSVTHA